MSVPYVVPLGVAAALPSDDDANSYLAVVGEEGRFWLVDCADSPIQRLQRAGLDPLKITALFVTHFHPDHVYGIPALLLGLFLLEKRRGLAMEAPLPIYARPEVAARVEALLSLFEPRAWWEAEPPLAYHFVEPLVGVRVGEGAGFVVSAAPTRHSVPSMAVRFDWQGAPRCSFTYSSDTAPAEEVVALAKGTRLLFHEAGGKGHGHTLPAEAGEIAARASAEELVLIHTEEGEAAAQEATRTFGRPVELAVPFVHYPFGTERIGRS